MKMILRQMRRFKSSFGFAVAIICCMSFNAFAGATYDWKIPDNVCIVQKGPVDGVRTFATIQGAINSITDASATNHYVVKVMPGVYNETVNMKSYVELEGSGPESTRLSSINPVVLTADVGATYSLKNITIDSTSTTTSANYQAVVNIPSNATVTFDKVQIIMPDSAPVAGIYGSENSKIMFLNSMLLLAYGADSGYTPHGTVYLKNGSSLTIDKSTLNINTLGNMDGIVNKGTVVMRDSTFTLTATGQIFPIAVENLSIYNSNIVTSGNDGDIIHYGNIEIHNSSLSITSTDANNTHGIWAAGSTNIAYTTISSAGDGVTSAGNLKISNSAISGTVLGIRNIGGSFRIGNSQIIGGHNGTGGVDKVVNCYDGNFTPIPNL